MSLDKYIDLIISNTIKFTQISSAADKLEVELMLHRLSSSGAFSEKQHLIESAKMFAKILRSSYYISCWTGKENECRSLWFSYLGASRVGVAIKSTVGQFVRSCDWGQYGFDYRKVDYRDDFDNIEEMQIDTTWINSKAKAYSSEEEIRFAVNESMLEIPSGELSASNPPRTKSLEELPPVVSFYFDMDVLISEIWISPYCSEWQHDMIKALTTRINPDLSGKLRRSDIREVL